MTTPPHAETVAKESIPDLYSVSQVARICHITPQAVRKAIAEGRLAAFKAGGTWWLIEREAIRRFQARAHYGLDAARGGSTR